mmetsp:Transcript_5844/g.8772  ORF Transcript_5844/g.8772 Transcript_5844/m.8772 type:complete len:220 (+) Transcript_5844:370-1029(+)
MPCPPAPFPSHTPSGPASTSGPSKSCATTIGAHSAAGGLGGWGYWWGSGCGMPSRTTSARVVQLGQPGAYPRKSTAPPATTKGRRPTLHAAPPHALPLLACGITYMSSVAPPSSLISTCTSPARSGKDSVSTVSLPCTNTNGASIRRVALAPLGGRICRYPSTFRPPTKWIAAAPSTCWLPSSSSHVPQGTTYVDGPTAPTSRRWQGMEKSLLQGSCEK